MIRVIFSNDDGCLMPGLAKVVLLQQSLVRPGGGGKGKTVSKPRAAGRMVPSHSLTLGMS